MGDLFNNGLYSRHIELKNTPFLGWESPEQMNALIAADVMSSNNLCYVYPITRVRSVERLLRTTAHGAFLVITPMHSTQLFQRKKGKRSSRTENNGSELIASSAPSPCPCLVTQPPVSSTRWKFRNGGKCFSKAEEIAE